MRKGQQFWFAAHDLMAESNSGGEDYWKSLLHQVCSNLQDLSVRVGEVSLNQQRDSVRVELLEKQLLSNAKEDNSQDPLVQQPNEHAVSQDNNSANNPLLLLAECAENTSRPTGPTRSTTRAEQGLRFTEDDESDIIQLAESVKDKVKTISLPGELLLPSTQGIKVGDRKRAAVVRGSGAYVATCLKLVKSWSDIQNINDTDIQELFSILYAHMRHLQKDLNECVLESHTPKSAMDYFRYLNSNDKCLTKQESKNFETACNWAIASQRANDAERRGRYQSFRRGSGRRGQRYNYYNSSRGGQQKDVYEDAISAFDHSFPTKEK